MKQNAVRKQPASVIIFLIAVALTSIFAACSSGKGGGSSNAPFVFPTPTPVPPFQLSNNFILSLSQLTTTPQAVITPPPPGTEPTTPHYGITLDFRDQQVTLFVDAVTVSGTSATVEIRIQNNSGAPFARTWLTAVSADNGVQMDSQSATGFLYTGVYYYIGSVANGGSRTVKLVFTLPAGVTGFNVYLDVVTVHDRAIFFSSQPTITAEIYSITPSATDIARVTYLNTVLYPIFPRWAPDGGRFAYSAYQPSQDEQLYLGRADGNGSQTLTCLDGYTIAGGFTRDGKGIYVRHYDPLLSEANIYLLDVAKALKNCADKNNLTPLTVAYPGSEVIPTVSPNWNLLIYPRREMVKALPPNPLTQAPCGTWISGMEFQYEAFNLYLLPLDPNTGLPNGAGAEVPYWTDSLFANGGIAFSPDGLSVVSAGGGCAVFQHYCPATGLPWALHCIAPITGGMYTLDLPTNLSDPSLPYNYMTAPGTGMYHLLAGTNTNEFDPTWSTEYGQIVVGVISSGKMQLMSLDPLNPTSTFWITNFPNANHGGRFMPPAPP